MIKLSRILVAGVLLSSSISLLAAQNVTGHPYSSVTQSMLSTAVMSGDHRKLSKLLEHGLEIDGEQGLALLKLAQEHNDNKTAELILEAGFDLAAHQDNSLLTNAISKGNIEMFEILLEAGAVVNGDNIKQLLKNARSSDNPRFKTLIETAYSANN